jgi:signal transduction histidine kinase
MTSSSSPFAGFPDAPRRDLEQARSALDAQARSLAMVSHEARTLLSGVLGTLDLMIDTPLSDDQRAMLMRAREASMSLLTISNDILDFSRIEAGGLDVESRPVSIAGLVEEVCAVFADEAARKAIELSLDVDAAIPPLVAGDPVRLRQVLVNLIGNAVKFTHSGGVRVEARPAAGGELELAVQDTGIGIDAGAIETLFEPFRQADVTIARRYGGTGLGLAIVRQLVERMHGNVRCESTPGVGSRLTVTLPLRPWTADMDAAAAPEAAAPRQGRRVLLAEDHPINREVIARQLLKLGYVCECAEDGQKAWEMLQAAESGPGYDLLLVDCHMPKLDGHELTRRLRAREARQALPRLPIVALTASVHRDDAERCLELGMDACLFKPARLEDLRTTLLQALQGASAAAAGDAQRRYARLAVLCEGDSVKVAELVRVFMRATEQDMAAMERAVEAADLRALGQLAHRLSSACHQLGEDGAVRALQTLEWLAQAGGRELLREAYHAARHELEAVMARARAFASDTPSQGIMSFARANA